MNGYSPGDPGYWTAFQLKAQAMVESGGNQATFEADPLQVNNPGDWVPQKTTIAGLTEGQTMTPATSAQAALDWLQYKGSIFDANGDIVGWRGDLMALERYNGNVNIESGSNGLPNDVWYGQQVMALTSAAVENYAMQSTVSNPNYMFSYRYGR